MISTLDILRSYEYGSIFEPILCKWLVTSQMASIAKNLFKPADDL